MTIMLGLIGLCVVGCLVLFIAEAISILVFGISLGLLAMAALSVWLRHRNDPGRIG